MRSAELRKGDPHAAQLCVARGPVWGDQFSALVNRIVAITGFWLAENCIKPV